MPTTAFAASTDGSSQPGRSAAGPTIRHHPLHLPRDARLLQITVLAVLLALQISQFDFGATSAQAATTIAAALTTQALLSWPRGVPLGWRSPLITALSLSLLLRTHLPLIWLSAGILAIASKLLVHCRGKHLFNPAAFAIVVLLGTGQTWVLSPASGARRCGSPSC